MTDDFDDELNSLISACQLDLGLSGIITEISDDLINQAVISYCKWRFGAGNPEWKEIYEIQKAQLSMATNYTEWSK